MRKAKKGQSMSSLTPMLKSMIEGIERNGGACDTVVVNSDAMAGKVLASLIELGRDFHVIADNKLGNRIYVTSQESLSRFPGGCSN
jgi:hypothetical protein